jgi:SET domain-containing protein
MADSDNTGFCVPYTVRDTPDKGRGVFVEVPVRKGTIVWRFVRGQYAVYDERSFKELLANLSPGEVVYELEHNLCTPEYPDYVVRFHDDGALINHSPEPNVAVNTGSGKNGIPYDDSAQNAQEVANALLSDRFSLIAIRDVNAGDELTHDYNIGVANPPFYDALYKQYNLSEPWMEQGRATDGDEHGKE